MTGPARARVLTQRQTAWHRRKFGMEFNLVLFQVYESYEIKFPTKISSFTVVNLRKGLCHVSEKCCPPHTLPVLNFSSSWSTKLKLTFPLKVESKTWTVLYPCVVGQHQATIASVDHSNTWKYNTTLVQEYQCHYSDGVTSQFSDQGELTAVSCQWMTAREY